MTSNIGSHFLLEGLTDRGEIEEPAKNNVMRELRQYFRPEFLNRVDDIVLFKPLTLPEVEQIVGLMTRDLSMRLEERRVSVDITDAARKHIAESGYDPVYGARPLRRYIQRELETSIGRALIAGDVPEENVIWVGLKGNEIDVSHHSPN